MKVTWSILPVRNQQITSWLLLLLLLSNQLAVWTLYMEFSIEHSLAETTTFSSGDLYISCY